MAWNWLDVADVDWKVLLAVTVVSGVLFTLSFTSSVKIRVTVGDFGDVSDLFGTFWTIGTGLATFLSFALAVRGHYADQVLPTDDVSGPDTDVLIKTGGGDVYLDGVMDDKREIKTYEPDASNENRPEDENRVEVEDTTNESEVEDKDRAEDEETGES